MRSTKKNKAVKTSAKQELPSSQSADPAEPVEVSFVNEDDNAEQQPVEVSRGLSSERKKGGMTERQLKRINIIVDAVREHKVWLKMKLHRLRCLGELWGARWGGGPLL